MTRDTGFGLGLLLLAGLYWLGADQIRVSRLEGIVGAQAVPKALAVSLMILAALLIAQDLWRARRAAAAVGGADGEAGGTQAHLRAAGMLLIGMGYLVVVSAIGYVPAVALLVLATARFMGRPWSAELILLAVGGALLYYLLFVRLLGIPLPPGLWSGLAG
ncbi:MAG TPA: tripartite tricarboxylate transporter TctB family protein [Geminicoccaceae bacterium]|nr:tripartite tricarboxylate transporter TctB family protein [Geminicoccaceae bacterium]